MNDLENKTNVDPMVKESEGRKNSRIVNFFKCILNYLIKTSSGLATGLFATLIIGSIIGQIPIIFNNPSWLSWIDIVVKVIKSAMGIGIGVGVALTLKDKLSPIAIVSSGVVGGIASNVYLRPDLIGLPEEANNNPLVIYLAVIASIEITKLILRKKTPVDILLIPLLMLFIGTAFAFGIVFPLSWLMKVLANFVDFATTQQPFLMGMLISVIMGMTLTAPISSVALGVLIKIGGIAAGAAVVGCSVQMVGFAIQSIKDNKIGKVIAVGIGTSMLQFPNILKKPLIWLPTIIVSAVLGPISTTVFKLECSTVGAGMGTCGLVGQFATITEMGFNSVNGWIGMIVLQIIAPAILVFFIDLLFRKMKWIKEGDLKF